MPYARLVSMARMLSWATVVLAGCDPSPAPLDASADALDTASDGGCTGVPGVLEGERAIRAGALLPDLAFTTEGEPTSLARFHTPCEARVIVLRSMTAWSGPSAWHAAHTARLRAEPRVTIVDLLTEGADALPAESDDLASFRARYDVPPDALAIDPEDRLAPLAFGGVRLPLVAIVDARDLRVVRLLFAPHAGETEYEVQVALAAIEGRARPPLPSKALVDGRFTEDAWDLIRGMRWAPPGEDRSNAVADDVTAAGVGATFFEDAGLSPDGRRLRELSPAGPRLHGWSARGPRGGRRDPQHPDPVRRGAHPVALLGRTDGLAVGTSARSHGEPARDGQLPALRGAPRLRRAPPQLRGCLWIHARRVGSGALPRERPAWRAGVRRDERRRPRHGDPHRGEREQGDGRFRADPLAARDCLRSLPRRRHGGPHQHRARRARALRRDRVHPVPPRSDAERRRVPQHPHARQRGGRPGKARCARSALGVPISTTGCLLG
jgi:hypothetical protein